ncbi:MAG: hypothetical protein NTV51_32220, partial [Verrucomicrobia bacterium]|nr:hypothetical protein [Verrucomicrobiota bacterium]
SVIDRIWKQADGRYRSRPWPGRGVLFRATGSTVYDEEQDFDGQLGWQGIFGAGLEIVTVPGTHVTMWDGGQFDALMQQWDRTLENCRRETTAGGPAAPA